MAFFNKIDMIYDDYEWTALPNDDPEITDFPDSVFLNRHQGYEVLDFINKIAKILKLDNVESCQKIEKMLREDLPSEERSHENVMTWVLVNW